MHSLTTVEIAKIDDNKPLNDSLTIWSPNVSCIGGCNRYSHCDERSDDGICLIAKEYMTHTINSIFPILRENLNPVTTFKAGLLLLPLYRMLCRLKIDEMGVGSTMYETARGEWKMYPIFAEIRKTISSIDRVWSSMGLSVPNISYACDLSGDPDHYRRIMYLKKHESDNETIKD